jgi:hypothetical protein
MNEVQLIRSQIATERQHLRACIGDDLYYLSEIYEKYIRYILNRELSRGASHAARMSRARPLTAAEKEGLAMLRQALDQAAEALPGFEPSRRGSDSGAAARARCAALLRNLVDSAERIEALAEQRYTIDDWRDIAEVDADSVLEERRLWAEVLRHGSGSPAR